MELVIADADVDGLVSHILLSHINNPQLKEGAGKAYLLRNDILGPTGEIENPHPTGILDLGQRYRKFPLADTVGLRIIVDHHTPPPPRDLLGVGGVYLVDPQAPSSAAVLLEHIPPKKRQGLEDLVAYANAADGNCPACPQNIVYKAAGLRAAFPHLLEEAYTDKHLHEALFTPTPSALDTLLTHPYTTENVRRIRDTLPPLIEDLEAYRITTLPPDAPGTVIMSALQNFIRKPFATIQPGERGSVIVRVRNIGSPDDSLTKNTIHRYFEKNPRGRKGAWGWVHTRKPNESLSAKVLWLLYYLEEKIQPVNGTHERKKE